MLLAGFVLRLVYFYQIKDAFLFDRPFLDAGFYQRWAIEVASGDWAGAQRGVFAMSPGYAYFLACIYTVFGIHIGAAVFIQLLLGLGCGWMIFLVGRKHLSWEAGLFGAALYLFYSPELFFESSLLKASLINAVNTGALLAASTASPAGWALSGILVGYSAHLRPSALLLVPLIALWLRLRPPRGVLATLLFAGGLLAALLPVAARNYLVGGEWVWTTTHGGMNLYSAYNPENRGPYEALRFARTDPAYEQDDFLQEARRRSGRQDLTSAQASRFWYGEAWRFIRDQPVRAASLMAKKALIFFNGYETPINMDYYRYRTEYGSVLSLPLVTFTLLLPLALVGVARAAPNLLLLGYLAVIFASNVVFLGAAEYRFPAVPVLCAYGGWAMHRIVQDIRERSPGKLALSGAGLLILVGLVSFDVYGTLLGMPDFKRDVAAKSLYNSAVEYQAAGRDDQAIALYTESARLHPADAETQNNLGVVLARRGRLEEAITHFESALPGLPQASRNLHHARDVLDRRRQSETHSQPPRPAAALPPEGK